MENFYFQRNGYQLFVQFSSCLTVDLHKPTLVFLHDSWGCAAMWGDFPESMNVLTGLNTLVYDRRGHGKSSSINIMQRTEHYLQDEADELMALLDDLGIDHAILYGHSDGATIALIAAAVYPERIDGLLLEGPHSFIEDSGKAAVLATWERAKETSLLARLDKFHGGKAAELFRLWHETWLSDFFAQWSLVSLLSQINCPVLAFQGVDDEFGSIEQLNVLKVEIPAAVTIAEISNAAHTPRNEARKETMEWVSAWFESTYNFT